MPSQKPATSQNPEEHNGRDLRTQARQSGECRWEKTGVGEFSLRPVRNRTGKDLREGPRQWGESRYPADKITLRLEKSKRGRKGLLWLLQKRAKVAGGVPRGNVLFPNREPPRHSEREEGKGSHRGAERDKLVVLGNAILPSGDVREWGGDGTSGPHCVKKTVVGKRTRNGTIKPQKKEDLPIRMVVESSISETKIG